MVVSKSFRTFIVLFVCIGLWSDLSCVEVDDADMSENVEKECAYEKRFKKFLIIASVIGSVCGLILWVKSSKDVKPHFRKVVLAKDVYVKRAFKIGNTDVTVVYGNVADQFRGECGSAVVNAANQELAAGDGVCGDMFKAAGLEELREECCKLPKIGQGSSEIRCNAGSAVMTSGCKLEPVKIIHAVGPSNKSGQQLRDTYSNLLRLAHEKNITSVAIPAISSGIYGFPKKEAAKIAVDTVVGYLRQHPSVFKEIRFAVYEPDSQDCIDYDFYRDELSKAVQI